MFLVPLNTPGIEIQGIRTVDGDRTNIVYYSDVRVDDKYRLGDVNAGWTVVREPLNVEHGAVAAARDGLQDVSIMMHQAGFMADAVDKAAARVAAGSERAQAHRRRSRWHIGWGAAPLGWKRRCARPSIFGRVAHGADDARHLPGPDGHPGHRVDAARSAPTARPTTAPRSMSTASRRWSGSTAARSRCSAT